MPIEEYDRLVKEQNTLRNKRLNVLLDAVENCSVPSQRELAKTKEVHLTGVPQSASKHGKYRAARFKATSIVDTMVDTPRATSLPYSLHWIKATFYGSLWNTARRVSCPSGLLKWRKSENLMALCGPLRQKHRLSKRNSRMGIGGLGLMSDIYQNDLVRIL